jgi:hypothetical protein
MTIDAPALKHLTDVDRLALAFEWLEACQFGTNQFRGGDCIECDELEETHDDDTCRLSQWLDEVAAIIDSRLAGAVAAEEWVHECTYFGGPTRRRFPPDTVTDICNGCGQLYGAGSRLEGLAT